MDLTMEGCLRGLHQRGFAPRHIIDVGASHGSWTTMASGYWPASRYSLFEPLSEHAATLDALKSRNPNIAWFPCALGSRKTTLPISINPDNLDIASLTYAGPGSRNIAVERLDDFLASGAIAPADLIKIDVQGFEPEVLLGAETLLKHVSVAIIETYFFRFSPQMRIFHEMVATMYGYGFRVYEVLDPLRRPHDQAVGQCDICYVRANHKLIESNAWA